MLFCYHRKLAWLERNQDGSIKGMVFKHPSSRAEPCSIPCGKCLACRANNAQSWALRVMHESVYCDGGCFITLTYHSGCVPVGYNLDKTDVQLFMKRLRRYIEYNNLGHIRSFLLVGEYGEKKGRPHYHLLILGWSPNDLKRLFTSDAGDEVYTSDIISKCWNKGICVIGKVEDASAAYVARYGKKLFVHNTGTRVKPFQLASRNIPLSNGQKGALGAQWLIDNHSVLRLGYINVATRKGVFKRRIPDYYFDLMEKWYPGEYEVIKELRYDYAMKATNGFLIVDQFGKPTICLPKGKSFDDDDVRESLRLLSGVKDDNIDTVALVEKASECLRLEAEAQNKKLGQLKRNIE